VFLADQEQRSAHTVLSCRSCIERVRPSADDWLLLHLAQESSNTLAWRPCVQCRSLQQLSRGWSEEVSLRRLLLRHDDAPRASLLKSQEGGARGTPQPPRETIAKLPDIHDPRLVFPADVYPTRYDTTLSE